MYFGNTEYTSVWTNYFSELFIFHLLAACYNRSKIFNMKRLLFSLLFALVAFAGIAQSSSESIPLLSDVAGKTTAQKQRDTISTGTETQSAKIAGYRDVVSIQVEVNRLSGTAGGTAILQGSLYGTANTFVNIDTLTFTNVAAQTKIFEVNPSKYVFYRVAVTVSGTQSLDFRSLAVARKN